MLNDKKRFKFKIKFPKFKFKDIENVEENMKEEDATNKNERVELLHFKTIKEMFEHVTETYSDKVAILQKFDHKEEFKEITYADFRRDVLAFGTMMLDNLKITKEDKVIIISENTYQWYVSYMACLTTGIIAVPVDKELPEEEILNVVSRSMAKCVIYSPKKKENIQKLEERLENVKYFIEMYESTITGKNVGFNYLLDLGYRKIDNVERDKTYLREEIDPDSFKVLIFTSGTTSNSKGVMICNRNLVDNVYGALSYAYMDYNDRLLSILPLHHTYESTIGFLMPFSRGASVAVCEGLKYIVPNIMETQPTIMLTVPLLVENLYKKINSNIKKSKKEALVNSMIHVTNALKTVNLDVKRKVFSEIHRNLGGKLRIMVSAAAPIDPKIGKWIEDIGIEFLQGYGLTETAPIAAFTPEDKPKVGSVGKAVNCAEIKIDNPNEKGEGEILIKSSTLMLGYYDMEEETKKAIVDGWFHSGDVGYLDSEGYLYITGRQKNVIVTRNGKNVYPEELELMIGKIPFVKECMVYGYEDEEKDDWKVAVKVIPNYDEIKKIEKDADEKIAYDIIWKEIKEKVNKKLVSYKAIKRLEIKNDEFEKTTTMKIKRFAELKKDKIKK